MTGVRRVLAGLVAAAAPLGAVLAPVLPPGVAESAAALTPGVGFTADALPTYQTNGIAWSLGET